jgi:hypothetical protein
MNFFFDSMPRSDSIDIDLWILTDSMDTVNGLLFPGRIPVMVSQNAMSGAFQGQASACNHGRE